MNLVLIVPLQGQKFGILVSEVNLGGRTALYIAEEDRAVVLLFPESANSRDFCSFFWGGVSPVLSQLNPNPRLPARITYFPSAGPVKMQAMVVTSYVSESALIWRIESRHVGIMM
jgi:hypothetical protein